MELFPARRNYQNCLEAESYDQRRIKCLLHRMEYRALERAVKAMPKHFRVLDIPCGTGRLLPPLIEHFKSVVGCDISNEMLAVAKRRYSNFVNIDLKQADAVDLPFRQGKFDCVFSARFFGHTPPKVRRQVLREMAHVTRSKVVLMLYVRDPLISLRKLIQWKVRPPKGPWYPIHSYRELYQLFDDAGLSIEKIRSLMPGVMESRIVFASKKTEPKRLS